MRSVGSKETQKQAAQRVSCLPLLAATTNGITKLCQIVNWQFGAKQTASIHSLKQVTSLVINYRIIDIRIRVRVLLRS
jgi:hypothetical protein